MSFVTTEAHTVVIHAVVMSPAAARQKAKVNRYRYRLALEILVGRCFVCSIDDTDSADLHYMTHDFILDLHSTVLRATDRNASLFKLITNATCERLLLLRDRRVCTIA
jgi:hypothetical protein